MDYFILVASAAELKSGDLVSAYQLALRRVASGMWPLFSHTQNKRQIKAGDRCLVYISGTQEYKHHVVASFDVTDNALTRHFVDDFFYSSPPSNVLKFSSTRVFEKPVDVKPLINKLSICPANKEKWGSALQGGARRIPEDDYLLLMAMV